MLGCTLRSDEEPATSWSGGGRDAGSMPRALSDDTCITWGTAASPPEALHLLRQTSGPESIMSCKADFSTPAFHQCGHWIRAGAGRQAGRQSKPKRTNQAQIGDGIEAHSARSISAIAASALVFMLWRVTKLFATLP